MRSNKPSIVIGTYVRTTAIDHLVYRFLESQHGSGKKKQIISLGAGTDTRVFQLLSSRTPPPNVVYHEIDFPVNTAAKIRAVRSSSILQGALGSTTRRADEVKISDTGDALHSPSYHIHPLDLRSLAKRTPSSPSAAGTTPSSLDQMPHLQDVDPTLPTLLISECCLIYLSPQEADDVVHYFTKTLFPPSEDTTSSSSNTPLGLIIYEPIRPDDPFGRTMVSNLATRGIQLQTLNKYATLDAQRTRLREYGFGGGQTAADVDYIWERWVSEEEKERVAGLEMLDEMEEWKLLAAHYCVAWGWKGDVFDCWRDIGGQLE